MISHTLFTMAKDLNRLPKFGLAIDWETSGYSLPDYAKRHQGITFGAIVFDVRTLEPVEQIYREIKFDPKYEWSLDAERVHGTSRAHLDAHGISQEEAAVDLGNIIVKYFGTEPILLLGHRVYFDKAFTNQLMDVVDIQLEYHPTMIDSCSIATVLMELTYSEDIFMSLGLPPRGKHNSLEDIQYTLSSVKRMKQFFLDGVVYNFGNT